MKNYQPIAFERGYIGEKKPVETYLVKWESRITGVQGKCEAEFDSRTMAQAFANHQNREWPFLRHWVTTETTPTEPQK